MPGPENLPVQPVGDRQAALHPRHVVFFSAPAGSGKTSVLTQRYLALVEAAPEPDQALRHLLAITYTRNAATEMKARILHQLRQQKPRLYQRVRHRLQDLRVKTMHAFFLELVQRFAEFLGRSPDLQVLENPTVWLKPWVRRQLARGALDPASPWYRFLEAHAASGRFEDLVSDLVQVLDRLLFLSEFWQEEPREFVVRSRNGRVSRRLLWPLLKPLVEELRQAMEHENLITFNDMERLAYHLIFEDDHWSEVLESFDEATHHLLVDEFQDTNLFQWAILRKLTEEWRSGWGAKAEQGILPTLFVVGDENQSIYAFRNANVAVFRRALQDLASDTAYRDRFQWVQVRENFRSTPAIVGFVNAVFAEIPEEDEGFHYVPFQAQRQTSLKGRVILRAVPAEAFRSAQPGKKSQVRVSEYRKAEARAVAQWIRQILEKGWPVEPPGDASPRPVEPGDIALLVKNTTGLDLYLNALEREGIPVVLTRQNPSYRLPVSLRILGLLIGLLVSPEDPMLQWGLMSTTLVSEDQRSAYLRQRLLGRIPDQPLRLLAPYLKERDRRPLAEVLWQVLQDLGFFQRLRDLDELRWVLRVLERLRQAEAEGALWHELAVRRQEFLTGSPSLLAGRNAVQVHTVHGAKGLEWPVVVIPSGTWSEGRKGGGFVEALRRQFKETLTPEGTFQVLPRDPEEARQEEERETYRLLYVALTRARDYLMVSFPDQDPLSPSAPSMEALVALLQKPPERLQHLARQGLLVFQRDPLAEDLRPGSYPKPEPPVFQGLQHPEPVPLEPVPRIQEASALATAPRLTEPADPILGRVVHEVLREVFRRGILPTDLELAEGIRQRLRAYRLEVRDPEVWQALDQVNRVLQGPLWPRVQQAERRYTEFPLWLRKPEAVVGRADLVLVFPDRVEVYDFKTHPLASEADLERLLQAYRPQLAAYARALNLLFQRPAQAFLVPTATGRPVLLPDLYH